MKKILKISTLLFALMLIVSSCGQTEEEYAKAKDHNAAITDVTKAIEPNLNDAKAYFNRGLSKHNLKDYNGAISDYTKAIELDPNDADAYFTRGFSKHKLKDYNGAISDYTKGIELNPNYAEAYLNRGISKGLINDLKGACEDAKKSASLGYDASKVIEIVCKNAAITNVTKAIEPNLNDAIAYYNRGVAKYYNNDLKGACEDAKKSSILGNDASPLIQAVCN